jgi:threonine/homoserine/homoserine lactone efflux protein
MSMTNAMHYGYPRILKFLAGMVSGFFIIMLASGLLNVVLTGWLPALEKWLKILGAVYMLYLALPAACQRKSIQAKTATIPIKPDLPCNS